MPSTYAPLSTGHTNSYAPVVGPAANGGTWSSGLRSKTSELKRPKRSGPPPFVRLQKAPSRKARAHRVDAATRTSSANSTTSDDAASAAGASDAGLDAADEALRVAEAEYEAARRQAQRVARRRRRDTPVRRGRSRNRLSDGGLTRLPTPPGSHRRYRRTETPHGDSSSGSPWDGRRLKMELKPEPEVEPATDREKSFDSDSDTEIAEEMTPRSEKEELSDEEHEGNLRRFLVQARLGHYEKKLSVLGAATTEDLFELGPGELEEVGMRKLERNRLGRFLQRYILGKPRLQEEGQEVPDLLFDALAVPTFQKPRLLLRSSVSRVAGLRQRIVFVAWRSWMQQERLIVDLDRARAAEIAAVQSRALLRSSFDNAAEALSLQPSQAVEALVEIAAAGTASEAVAHLASQLKDGQWEAEEIEAAAVGLEEAAAALALPLPLVAQATEAMSQTSENTSVNEQQAQEQEQQQRDETVPNDGTDALARR